jgi:hypothetical protein
LFVPVLVGLVGGRSPRVCRALFARRFCSAVVLELFEPSRLGTTLPVVVSSERFGSVELVLCAPAAPAASMNARIDVATVFDLDITCS